LIGVLSQINPITLPNYLGQNALQASQHLLGVTALIAIFLTAPARVKGATINAKGVSLRDVSSAIASSRAGDTVVVPAGTASWTSTLTIAKDITLQGAGNDQTVILDDVPREKHREMQPRERQLQWPKHAKFSTGAGPWPGQADQKAAPIIRIQLTPAQFFRLTGFTFRYGSVTTIANNGGVHLEGTCPSTRIDHCHFDQLYANPNIMTRGQIYGVVDHCVLDERPRCLTFQVWHDGWGGASDGDGSWADSAHFGSEKFLFIEDNTFRNPNGYLSVGIDSYAGARYVARYNVLTDTPIGGHGTESTGRFRGVRAIEIYGNKCIWNNVVPRGQLRSGTLLEYNNVWTGTKSPDHATGLTCYRQYWPFKFWGGANGNNPLDLNDTEGNGTNVPGHSPHLYASGTHTGATGSATLVVANAGWKPNQWVGYSVTNTTQTLSTGTGTGFHPSSHITANTSDTLTFVRDPSFGPSMSFNNGDHFAIYKLLIALDQPGRGKGDSATTLSSWPNQAAEPVYAWGNTHDNAQLDVESPYPTIQENRDFYNQKTPFDGTAGVGVGPRSGRPSNCRTGVAYWATDENTLYVCGATNTWSVYYKPYVYPHPLVSGGPGSRKIIRSPSTDLRHDKKSGSPGY
jgi:hypothetical protein